MGERHRRVLIGLGGAALVAVTLLLYWPVLGFDSINYDDDAYVFENPYLATGFTWQSFRWSLTSFHSSNWHPLTWLSHALDISLFGDWPGGHHYVNVLWHVMNALLLWRFFSLATGKTGAAWYLAAVFAWHPTHVESVAWIAERKDVLSTFFGLLTLIAYHRYAVSSRFRWLGIAAAMHLLNLSSKPMLVTIPCVLLLLDIWPYGRIQGRNRMAQFRCMLGLLVEKAPFFAVSALVSAITIVSHRHALVPLETLSQLERLHTSVWAYLQYLRLTFWPWPLFNPYPMEMAPRNFWSLLPAYAAIAFITAAALLRLRRAPYLLVGWLWFLGILVPPSNLMQTGHYAYADRYLYLSMTGLCIMVVWGAMDVVRRYSSLRLPVRALAGGSLAGCVIVTSLQLPVWRNSETLCRHALAHYERNSVAHNNLGKHLIKEGRLAEAERHLARALEIAPANVDAKHNLAAIHLIRGEYAEAQGLLLQILERNPNDVDALVNAAVLLEKAGKLRDAKDFAEEAHRLDPDHRQARALLEQLRVRLATP